MSDESGATVGEVAIAIIDTFPPLTCCDGVLIYSGGNQLFMADLDTGHIVSIYDAAYTDAHHWRFIRAAQRPGTPQQVAFFGRRSDAGRQDTGLYLADLRTRRLMALPTQRAVLFDLDLSWSPDGQFILYRESQLGLPGVREATFKVLRLSQPAQTWEVFLDSEEQPMAFNSPLWSHVTGQVMGLYRGPRAPQGAIISHVEALCWERNTCRLQEETVGRHAWIVYLLDSHPTDERMLAVGDLMDENTQGKLNLLEVNLTTGHTRRVNPVLDDGVATVWGASYSPDGQHIVYNATVRNADWNDSISHPREMVIVDADTYEEVARLPIASGDDLHWGPPLPDGVLPTPPSPPPPTE